jgi:hypothetical protein
MRLINKYHSYWTEDRGSIPGRGRTFLFSTTSRPALGPTEFVLVTLSTGKSSWSVNLATHLLLPRIRMSGASPTLQHISAWRGVLNSGTTFGQSDKMCNWSTESLVKLCRYTPWRCLGGEEVKLLLVVDHSTKLGWVISVTLRPLFTPRKVHRYPLNRRLGGPLPGIEPRSTSL